VSSRALRRVVTQVVLGAAIMLAPFQAAAQDLFELEVFEYDGAPPGKYEVALHANGMSRGGVTPDSVAASHRPAHISVELTRG